MKYLLVPPTYIHASPTLLHLLQSYTPTINRSCLHKPVIVCFNVCIPYMGIILPLMQQCHGCHMLQKVIKNTFTHHGSHSSCYQTYYQMVIDNIIKAPDRCEQLFDRECYLITDKHTEATKRIISLASPSVKIYKLGPSIGGPLWI